MTKESPGVESEAPVDVPQTFHVHDAATANWVVRKIVAARQYAERVQGWADAEVRRAEREEQFLAFHFGSQLQAWSRGQIALTHPHRNSIALPAGTVGFRLQPLRLEVQDQPKLLAWCKRNAPAAIVTSERVLKGALMASFTTTGECPDGAIIRGGATAFYIR